MNELVLAGLLGGIGGLTRGVIGHLQEIPHSLHRKVEKYYIVNRAPV